MLIGKRKSSITAYTALIFLALTSLISSTALGAPSGHNEASSPQAVAGLGQYVWSVQRVDAPQFFYNMTDRMLRLDSNGNPHIAFGADHLYYAWYSSGIWHQETVDDQIGVGQYASLALDSSNHPHISYYDSRNGALKYAYFNGTNWQIQVVDQPATSLAASAAAVEPGFPEELGPQYNPIPWREVSPLGGSPLGTSAVAAVADGVGQFTSIAIDSDNRPRISYYDAVNEDLKYARWTGSAWSVSTVNSTDKVGKYSSLALDSDDNPRISYLNDSKDNLRYAVYNGSSWKKEDIDTDGFVGAYSSLALDDNDIAHVSYYEYDLDTEEGNLKYASRSGGSWTTYRIDQPGDVGLYTSIAIRSNNQPAISYFDQTNGDLKYASYNGSVWTISEPDTTDNVGTFTSLVFNKSDRPRIAYFDATESNLKYASYDGSSWGRDTVASARDVGLSTSLDLDSNDQPQISYFNDSNDILKIALTSGSSWQIGEIATANVPGLYSSLKVDFANHARVAFYEAGTGNLLYGAWYGSQLGLQHR